MTVTFVSAWLLAEGSVSSPALRLPPSPTGSHTAHVQPGAHRILASPPANLLFTSFSFFI